MPTDNHHIKKFAAGDIILNSGETPDYVFLLKSGFVKHSTDSSDGKELILHIYTPGALFPLMWGLNDEVPNYTLAALTTCSVVCVPKDEMVEYYSSKPKELMELTKKLLKGISGLSKRIEILSFENARKRVVSTLQYLHKHFGPEFSFTHENLASLTGLTRERVSIEMKKLKDQGLVSYKRNLISVTDIDKLSSL